MSRKIWYVLKSVMHISKVLYHVRIKVQQSVEVKIPTSCCSRSKMHVVQTQALPSIQVLVYFLLFTPSISIVHAL